VSDVIAVLNAGSSSLKFSLFAVDGDKLDVTHRGQIEGLHSSPQFVARNADGKVEAQQSWEAFAPLGHDGALARLMQFVRDQLAGDRLVGVGHRVVHGGPRFSQPLRVDAHVLAALETYIPLAPLHQPHNLAPIRALLQSDPHLPQVACFDTAFHHTNPQLAQMFALPHALYEEGVRRYGFHGLSYEYIASVLPALDARAGAGRTVVLHLGSGSSMCALSAGRSIASTMGFTALDGLPMGTRSGSVDPGVLLYLMDQRGMDARGLEKLLYEQSGMLGVSGLSSDMRTLRGSNDPRARLALDLYVYRIGRELGGLAAALGGLDALVFTAGIGENWVGLRERVSRNAAWLGVQLDPAANAAGGPRISTRGSAITAWVIATNEELTIARHTRALLPG
jgi:acetate kinase